MPEVSDAHRKRPRFSSRKAFDELVLLETDDHVIWPLHLATVGYGVVTLNGRNHYVHRLALERHTSPQPSHVLACHIPQLGCPKACMNYRHLYWGDQGTNAADTVTDGVSTRGERHGRHVLTEDDVREIRRLFDRMPGSMSARCALMAPDYGVSKYTIKAVVNRSNWSWLE
jgi:hypothetical protein